MCTFDWESFLRRWSWEFSQTTGEGNRRLLSDEVTFTWLGYAGATEAQIAQAETRLGVALPPSYRAFLQVSNGWRQTTPFIDRLWSTEAIEWFSVRHQAWITEFTQRYQWQRPINTDSNGSMMHRQLPVIPDSDYFDYGSEQDCLKLRLEYLQTALEISDRGENSSIYLLNPQVINSEGEWEAWFFSNLLPGADRYRSFRELMEAEYQNFLELKTT